MVTELMCLEQDNTILTLDRTVENSAVRQWSRAQESLWKQSLAEKVSLYHLKVFGHMIFLNMLLFLFCVGILNHHWTCVIQSLFFDLYIGILFP